MRRALGLLFVIATACGSSGPVVEWEATETAAWQHTNRELMVDARIAFDAGERKDARRLLARILLANPDLLTARFMLQELDLTAPGADVAVLAASARARAAEPGAAPIEALLAARLEPDGEAARLLVEGALAANLGTDFAAACRYALAHLALERGDGAAARNALDVSLELDPGGLRARRLEARLAAADGEAARADALLDHWLDLSEEAPEISGEVWYAACVELSTVRAALDDSDGAREALARLEAGRAALGATPFPAAPRAQEADALFARAALDAEDGEPMAALEKVRAARKLVDEDSRAGRLAMVDEALLAELFLDRDLDAAAAWRAVLERFDQPGSEVDFDELLRALEARVRLARLEANAPK